MKSLLKHNKGKLAITASLFSVAAIHAQTFEMYNAQTGALISQSSVPTLSGGPWDGQALPATSVLDMASTGGINSVVLLDPDGSVSAYRMDTGALVVDPTATTFVNGPVNGLTLAASRSQVMGAMWNPSGNLLSLIVGADKNYVYQTPTLNEGFSGGATTVTGGPHDGESFASMASLTLGTYTASIVSVLDPDGSVSFYNVVGGVLVADPTANTFSGGLLDGMSFASVVGQPGTENQPGVDYLGMDIDSGGNQYLAVEVVPEPSTLALCSISGLFVGYRLFRRRQ